MTTELITQLGYVLAAGLFIFGLKLGFLDKNCIYR